MLDTFHPDTLYVKRRENNDRYYAVYFTFFQCLDYTVSNVRMNDELERIWKEMVVV
jgi:hypothetical protein